MNFQLGLGRTAMALGLALWVAGCSADRPTRVVQFGQEMLDMVIWEDWVPETVESQSRVYTHAKLENVRLHISSRLDDFGTPLQVTHVKSIVGKELNRTYGGVLTRVSLCGNALIDHSREIVGEDDDRIRVQEWVIARPVGYGHIARVLISLQIPPSAQAEPSIPEMIDALDKQAGDARIPRA